MAPLPPLVAAFLYVAFGTIASAVPALHSGATTFFLGVVIAFITGSSSASGDMLVSSVSLWLTSSTGIASMLLIPPLIHTRLVALASPSPIPLSVSMSVASRACSAIICMANFAASCAALAGMLRSFSSDWSWQQCIAVAAALCAGNSVSWTSVAPVFDLPSPRPSSPPLIRYLRIDSLIAPALAASLLNASLQADGIGNLAAAISGNMAGNFCWNLFIGIFTGCAFALFVLLLLFFTRTPALELTLTLTAVFMTFYVSEEGLCRTSGIVATMATCYIIHNRHASPLLPSSRAFVSAASDAFAFVSASIVTAAAGSSLVHFWSFSRMSPQPVRPADWGNVIALTLVLLLFRMISLSITCASASYFNPAAAPPPSPIDVVIATLSSSSSPLTIAFGLVICSSTTSPAAARSLFFCTLVPVTIFILASIMHVALYATGRVTSLAQSPARRLLSRECAENIFIDVERARATQLLSSPLAPANWSAMRSHSSALLSPLLQACDLDKRLGSSFASLPPASITSLSAFAETGTGSGAKALSASRCSDDDMFLRFLRQHTSAIAAQWCLTDAAVAFLELPSAYSTGCIEAFSSNVALPPDLLPEQESRRFYSIYRTITTCVLSSELVNAHLAIEASLRAHRHARQHYELWAQRECVAVDSCAAYLASLALTERLMQLRLQYDTCVPSISQFARTLRERAVSAHKLSCAVERWGATGMLHGCDKEVYSLIYSGNVKRITISASPPRVMAFCLMSVGASRRDKSLLRNLPPFAALDSDVFNSSIWPVIRHNRQFFPKGSHIMSEGSMATGVWLITHGCATRCIAAASDSSRQKQLVAETLVPGQSAGWEELALLMRPEFSRQAPVINMSSVVALSDVHTIFIPEKEIKAACSSPEFLFVQVLFAQPVLAASALMYHFRSRIPAQHLQRELQSMLSLGLVIWLQPHDTVSRLLPSEAYLVLHGVLASDQQRFTHLDLVTNAHVADGARLSATVQSAVMLLSGIPQTSASSPQLSLNASLPDTCIAHCFSDLDSPAFGPCGVELMAHIAQRLFSPHALVAQAMEVNSTTAHPVDIAAGRADMQPAAADTLATKVAANVDAAALVALEVASTTSPAAMASEVARSAFTQHSRVSGGSKNRHVPSSPTTVTAAAASHPHSTAAQPLTGTQHLKSFDQPASSTQSSAQRAASSVALSSVSPSDVLEGSNSDVSPSPSRADNPGTAAASASRQLPEAVAVTNTATTYAALDALNVSVDSHSSASPAELRSSRRPSAKSRASPRDVLLVFDSGDMAPCTVPQRASAQCEGAAASSGPLAAESPSLSPVQSSISSTSGSNAPAVPKSFGVAESLRRLQHARPLSSPLSSQLYTASSSPLFPSTSPSTASSASLIVPAPMFNAPPIARSASHEPPSSPTASSSHALEQTARDGRLKRSSSDSDTRKTNAVAAAAAAAAAAANAVSATAALVAASSTTPEQRTGKELQGSEQTLAERTFYPSSLIAAAAAVPAAMAAAAAMCFPDSHTASAPASITAAIFASADVTAAPHPAAAAVVSSLSFDETPSQSAAAAFCDAAEAHGVSVSDAPDDAQATGRGLATAAASLGLQERQASYSSPVSSPRVHPPLNSNNEHAPRRVVLSPRGAHVHASSPREKSPTDARELSGDSETYNAAAAELRQLPRHQQVVAVAHHDDDVVSEVSDDDWDNQMSDDTNASEASNSDELMGRVRAGLVNMTLTPREQPAIGFFAAASGGGSARAIMLSAEQSVDWKTKDSDDSWDANGSSGSEEQETNFDTSWIHRAS